jgi:hypothetical protein
MGRHSDEDTAPMTKVFKRNSGGIHDGRSGGLRGSWDDDRRRGSWKVTIAATVLSVGILAAGVGYVYPAAFTSSPSGKVTPAGPDSQSPDSLATTEQSSGPAPAVTVTRWRTARPSVRPAPTVTVPGPARTVYVTPSPRVSVRVEHREAPTVRVTVRIPGPTTTVWLRPGPEEIPGE